MMMVLIKQIPYDHFSRKFVLKFPQTSVDCLINMCLMGTSKVMIKISLRYFYKVRY